MGQTAGQQDAAQISRQTAQEQQDLFKLGGPSLKTALTDFIGDLGQPGGEPASIKTAFDSLKTEQGDYFKQAEASAPLEATQLSKQRGGRQDPGAAQYGSDALLATLEQSRLATQRATQESEVDASMAQKDFLLSNILGISSGAIGTSFGFGGSALQASQYNTSNPMGGALSGALSGASIGSAGGWIGAGVGAIVGGVGGYFAGGG